MAKQLTRRQKIMYGAGDIGFSLTSTILGVYFLFFMIEVVGLRPGIAAIPIGIGKVWDFVNDPIFGYISDRTRTRWGRRRPYLLFGALPLALTFTMLWYRPNFESTVALVVYYSVAYIIFEASATLLYMPYFALTPELTSDYDERTSLTSYRMFFSILGSLLAFTLPLIIVGSFTPENAPKVLLMGAIFGLMSALPMFVTFFGTEERKDLIDLEKPYGNPLNRFGKIFPSGMGWEFSWQPGFQSTFCNPVCCFMSNMLCSESRRMTSSWPPYL